MSSTILHSIVLLDTLSSVVVSNYCQVTKWWWCQKCLSMYLWVVLAHYPNLVKHSHDISPEILTTVFAWYRLKTNDLHLHFPFPSLYPNPMCCNSEKQHLCCINCPTICSYWDGPWGLLYYHWCISNVLCHENHHIPWFLLPAYLTNAQTHYVDGQQHRACLVGQAMSILVASPPNSFGTLPCWQLQATMELVTHIQHDFNCKSHLIINCDKLSDSMKQVLVSEH